MFVTISRALLGVALIVCANATAWAEYGRTAGSFDVSGGSATYTIPVWTPPGPNGMTPSIALMCRGPLYARSEGVVNT